MIHLSGTDPVDRALQEMRIYGECGVDAVIVENYHGSTEDVIETLKLVRTKMDVGVNILPNEYKQAFEIADKYGCSFIQLDFISGKYEKNQEIEQDYLKYREKYPHIFVMGGVWPKYYLPVKGSNLQDDLHKAKSLCDAVVVTGAGTGKETPLDKIRFFRSALGEFPLIIGAGVNADNIDQLNHADGAIVGSYFKPDGLTTNMVNRTLVNNLIKLRDNVKEQKANEEGD